MTQYDASTFQNFYAGLGAGTNLGRAIADRRQRDESDRQFDASVAYFAENLGVDPQELEGMGPDGLDLAVDLHLESVKKAAEIENKTRQTAVIENVIRPELGDNAAARAYANMNGIGAGLGATYGDSNTADLMRLLNIDAGTFTTLQREGEWLDDEGRATRDESRARMELLRREIATRIGLPELNQVGRATGGGAPLDNEALFDATRRAGHDRIRQDLINDIFSVDPTRESRRDTGEQEGGLPSSSPSAGVITRHEEAMGEPADAPIEFSESDLDEMLDTIAAEAKLRGVKLTPEQIITEAERRLKALAEGGY